MGVKGEEEGTALIQVRGDGARKTGKAWSVREGEKVILPGQSGSGVDC